MTVDAFTYLVLLANGLLVTTGVWAAGQLTPSARTRAARRARKARGRPRGRHARTGTPADTR